MYALYVCVFVYQVSYNAALNACARAGNWRAAVDMLDVMRQERVCTRIHTIYIHYILLKYIHYIHTLYTDTIYIHYTCTLYDIPRKSVGSIYIHYIHTLYAYTVHIYY
jgi:pentatricopeptide repeat protein